MNSMSTARRRGRLIASIAAPIAAIALALSGCSSSGPAPTDSAGQALTDVTFLLNVPATGEHTPFFYGLKEGIFAKHGINLKIQDGAGSTKTIQAVGAGQAEFGWADTGLLMANINKGVPVKSLGVYLQQSPAAVIVYKDGPIQTLADLAGKKIAVSAGDTPTTLFPLILQGAGVDVNSVTQQNLDAAGKIGAMVSGQVDGLLGFSTDQGPTVAAKTGKDVSYLYYRDSGSSWYANGLLANNSIISSNPALVQEMVDAVSDSFAAAVANPDAAATEAQAMDPAFQSVDVVKDQWNHVLDFLHTPRTQGKAPGVDDPADWTDTINTLVKVGLLDHAGAVTDYYDGDFAANIGK